MAQKQEGRKTIPVFTVFKNGAYVKNIILQSPFSGSESESDRDDCSLMVGRHHDCDIVLEHPSISRYHLQLKFNESSKKMSVMDLSSVHGTMISGEKIKPRVFVQVEEGDVVKFGASTRLYKLKWVSSVSDLEPESDAGSSSFSQNDEDRNGQIAGTHEQDLWQASAPPMEPEHEYSLGDCLISSKESHSFRFKEKPSTNIWLRRCLSANAPRIRTLSKKDKELDMVLHSGDKDLNNKCLANINQEDNNEDVIDFQEREVVHKENIYLRRCVSSSEPRIRMITGKDKELDKVLSEPRIFLITEKDKELDMVLYPRTNNTKRNQPEKKSNAFVTYLKETEIPGGKENPTINSVSEAVIPVDGQVVFPEIVFVSNEEPSTRVPRCISKPNVEDAHEEDAVQDKESKVAQGFSGIQLDKTIASENFQPMTRGDELVILPESCFTSFSEKGNIDNHSLQTTLSSLKSNDKVSYEEEDSIEEDKENLVNGDFDGIHLDITASIENMQDEIVSYHSKITNEENSVEDKENQVTQDFHGIHSDITAVSENLQEEIVCHNDKVMCGEGSVEGKENHQVTLDFHGIHLDFTAPNENFQEEIVSNNDRVAYEEHSVEDEENQVTEELHGFHLDITAVSELLQDEIVSHKDKVSYEDGSVEDKENLITRDFHGIHLDVTSVSENLEDEIGCHKDKVMGGEGSVEDKQNHQVTLDFHGIHLDFTAPNENLQEEIVSNNDRVTCEEHTVEDIENQFTGGDLHGVHSDITAVSELLQDEIVSHMDKVPYEEGSVEDKENLITRDFHGIHLDITSVSENLEDEIDSHYNKVEEDSVEDKENHVTPDLRGIHLDMTEVSEHLCVCHNGDTATLNRDEHDEKFDSATVYKTIGGIGNEEEEQTFFSDQENLTPNSGREVPCLSMAEAISAEETTANLFQGLSLGDCFGKRESEDIFLSNSSGKKFPSYVLGSRRRLYYDDIDTTESSTTQHTADDREMRQRILNTSWKDNNIFNSDTEYAFFQPDKENLTPQIHSTQVLRSSLKLSSKKIIVGAESCRVTALAGFDTKQSECRNDSPCRSNMDGMFPSDKENASPMFSRSLKSKARNSSKFKEEIILQRRLQERVPFQNLLVCSPSVNSMESRDGTRGSPAISAPRSRVPFQSLLDNVGRSPSITASRTTINKSCSSVVQPLLDHETVVNNKVDTKMKWYMVVDASCLLNLKSRRSLMLMEGLKGTQLIVPRMVIRELDSMRNSAGIFRRKSPASLVMQWIEECMVKMSWWIHVQSSNECVPVAATPPLSPHMMQPSQGGGEPGAYNASASFSTATQIPFSSYGSFAEIVSPTADDLVLDCALLFKRLKTDGHVVLLTKQVGLKIKALAEGMICESPEEFCQSLVNPYSERFLWLESTPRGPTWSSVDGVGGLICHEPLRESNRKLFAGGAKGLKLVLNHNCRYGQTNSAA